MQELSGGTPSANILPGLAIDEWLTRTDGSGTRYFMQDPLGSTVALSDGTGVIQTQYTYEPFGKSTITGASSASVLEFTGRENDGTGLYHYRSRDYDPQRQRFTSEDPIGFRGGINSHTYVDNQPANARDPLGLQAYNGDPFIWYLQPEEAKDPVKCLEPGQFYPGPVDAVGSPWSSHPNQIFKIPDYTGVAVGGGDASIWVPASAVDPALEGFVDPLPLPPFLFGWLPNAPYGWRDRPSFSPDDHTFDKLFDKIRPPRPGDPLYGRKPPKRCP